MNPGSRPGHANTLDPSDAGPSWALHPRVVAFILAWCAFGTFVASWSYLQQGASLGDDDSSHLAEIVTISRALKSGQSDFWFNQTVLGYPLFVCYQPLPSFVMGCLTAIVGWIIDPFVLYKLSIVVLWGIMPLCWYQGGRALGLQQIPSLLFGLLILKVRDRWDFGLGLNATVHYGLYTQLWVTALLPMTLGKIFTFVLRNRRGVLVPVTLLSATLLCHPMAGLLCGMAGFIAVVVRPKGQWARLKRLITLCSISVLFTGFWLIPFFQQHRYQGGFPWKWESTDGYPLGEALLRAVRGDLLDGEGPPWLTLAALLGLAELVCAWRCLERRWLLLCTSWFFLLWLGPATWGPMYRKLPLQGEMQVVRYVMGLQVMGLLLSANGICLLLRFLDYLRRVHLPKVRGQRDPAMIAGVVTLMAGIFVWPWMVTLQSSLKTFDFTAPEYAALTQILRESSGRFLVHETLDTVTPPYSNLLAFLSGRPGMRTAGRGYHDSLSFYYLDVMQLSREELRLYNVQQMVAKIAPMLLPQGWQPIWDDGTYKIYRSPEPGGYFEFIHSPLSITTSDLKLIRPLVREVYPLLYRRNALPTIRQFPNFDRNRIETTQEDRHTLILNGKVVLSDVPTFAIKYELLRQPSSSPTLDADIREESEDLNEYRARVSVRSPKVTLLLKASYHPYWTVAIDNETAEVEHVAPNLMAVEVRSGDHVIRWRYRNPLYQKVWFAACALLWVLWVVRAWVLAQKQATTARPQE